MKKVFALVLALTMLCCSAAFAADTDIAILVPNADHGWTGAVMTYAEEKAAAVNAEGTYTAQVITSADPANQITQVEDIIENQSANTVVILPQDNTLEVTMRRLADSGIPFVMFDRVIDSVSEQAVASVKGDNEGIGAETAKRFIEDGMVPGDKILIITKGTLTALGTPAELERQLRSAGEIVLTTDAPVGKAQALLAALPHITAVDQPELAADGAVTLRLKTDSDDMHKVSRSIFFAFEKEDQALLELSVHKASLEDVFLELTESGQAEESKQYTEEPNETEVDA